MKAALNGGLNLSVLDGWWAEAYDGTNGWAIAGDGLAGPGTPRTRATPTPCTTCSSGRSIPLFYDRDEAGVPRGWIQMVSATLRTNGPRFSGPPDGARSTPTASMRDPGRPSALLSSADLWLAGCWK